MQKIKLKWQNPLNFAQKVSDNYRDESWIFLYSGLSDKIKNSHSYIALFPEEKLITDNFCEAKRIVESSNKKWFGYLSYEVAQDFEKLPKSKKSFIDLPKIYLISFSLIFDFDHDKKILTAYFLDKDKMGEVLKYKAIKQKKNHIKVKKIDSNFSDESYLQTITDIQKNISDGDFYQTNLTRKFFGEFDQKLDGQKNFQLFTRLTKFSPANYSSFLKLNQNYIISSSPELFLEVKNRKVLSRPIKGTMPRDRNIKQDQKNRLTLKSSQKERAENLMIVDLVRNDLSKVCEAGSVEVKKLFAINSYRNVHHMSSEIHGKLTKNSTMLDVVKYCFPPGSMTGAPKVKAMEVAAKKEKINRGIYSGAIGFIDCNGEIKLSVVIRTLITHGKRFEFQTGGAITSDSNPRSELEEIFNKARGVTKILQTDSIPTSP